MEQDDPNNPTAAAVLAREYARTQDEERKAREVRTVAQQIVRAVWAADPATLPEPVRAARGRFAELVAKEGV